MLLRRDPDRKAHRSDHRARRFGGCWDEAAWQRRRWGCSYARMMPVYQGTIWLDRTSHPGAPSSLLRIRWGAAQPAAYSIRCPTPATAGTIGGGFNGGDRRFPLVAQPPKPTRVQISIGRRRVAVHRSTGAARGPDYPRLWRIVSDNNANRYEGYQAKTAGPSRVIRLVP